MALNEVVITAPVIVKETVDLALDQVTDPKVEHEITMPIPLSLDSTTTPPATKVWSDNVALAAGAKTLDLEALVNDNLPNVNFNGLKVQVFMMSCPSANTGPITVTPGASNDYDLGGASMSVEVNPGDTVVFLFLDNAPDVAAADSELDFAGTGTETFDILMVAG